MNVIYEGSSCTLEGDKETLTVVQTITLDLEKMNKDDIKKVYNLTQNYTYIDVDKTKDNFEAGGYTCTK